MNSISYNNQILTHIKHSKRGKILFPTDFGHLAPETAIRRTLSRLVDKGFLIRLAAGIYLWPKIDEELGVLYPSTEQVAEQLAKKEKVKVMPTGAYALNKLGLSTQVPMNVVYLTDGEPRKLKIGKSTLTFKPTTPKKMAAKGPLSSLVIQALQQIGKDNITDDIIQRINEVLQQETMDNLLADARTSPAWIARILYDVAKKVEHE